MEASKYDFIIMHAPCCNAQSEMFISILKSGEWNCPSQPLHSCLHLFLCAQSLVLFMVHFAACATRFATLLVQLNL